MRKSTPPGRHSAAYTWNSATSIPTRGAANSSVIAGSRNGCTPIPTAAVGLPPSASRASPKTSKTQISALRAGSSSRPTIHTAAIDRGLRSILARISSSPWCGVHPQWAGWNSRTTAPSRNGCCPIVLPTSPENTPDWMPETLRGSCSPGHHRPWSGGMVSRSSDPATAYVAALCARELHIGR